MNAKFFLDTNILVYSFDLTSPKKCKKARELIRAALSSNLGVISYQVVQEFINFALSNKSFPMSLSQTNRYFLKVLKPLYSVQSSTPLYIRGFSIKEATKFSWYDSLIVAGALEACCSTLYSEDLQHGRIVDGIQIENPFL